MLVPGTGLVSRDVFRYDLFKNNFSIFRFRNFYFKNKEVFLEPRYCGANFYKLHINMSMNRVYLVLFLLVLFGRLVLCLHC